MKMKEDTALAGDLGISGSGAGVPSPRGSGSGSGLAASSGSGLSGSAHGSRSGINVFGTEEANVDPSAQTAITSGVREQIDLASVGSGSGLLDLTRESDDTSLGAVLDEINPNSSKARAAAADIAEAGMDLDEPTGGVIRTAPPVYVEASDAMTIGFGAACFATALVVLFAIYAVFSGVSGDVGGVGKLANIPYWQVAAGGVGAALIFFVVGLLIGKSTTRSA
jgi:hypothetical protein